MATNEELLKQVLSEISDISEQVHGIGRYSDVRITIEPGSARAKILRIVSEHQQITSSEVVKSSDSITDATRPLTRLWETHLVDREKENGKYVYRLTYLGRQKLDEIDAQSTLDPSNLPPWECNDISEAQYKLLELIATVNDTPKVSDLEDAYQEMGYKKSGAQPQLTRLFEAGYVERTPKQPHRYWLSESGRDILPDDNN
jgi:predicted transcriptional regulator